jgi:hypothetical protein
MWKERFSGGNRGKIFLFFFWRGLHKWARIVTEAPVPNAIRITLTPRARNRHVPETGTGKNFSLVHFVMLGRLMNASVAVPTVVRTRQSMKYSIAISMVVFSAA